MDWIIGLIAFILILSIIIIVHEGGHFFFAKRAGILCYEFALGMGPVVAQKRKGETVYSLRAIPLGGYVSMAGEEVEADLLKGIEKVKLEFDGELVTKIILDVENSRFNDLPTYKLVKYDLVGTKEALEDELYIQVENFDTEEDPRKFTLTNISYTVSRDAKIFFKEKQEIQIAPYNRTFANKKLSARFISVFAGPLMNFILAWLIFVIMGLIGGYADTSATILDEVTEDTPAYTAGLRAGDEIISIGEFDAPLKKWDDISRAMNYYANGEATNFDGSLEVKYLRDGNVHTTTVYPNTIVYAIELVLATYNENDPSSLDKINLPLVGSYSDPNTNKKTKSYLAGLRENDLITAIEVISTGEKTEIKTKYDVLNFFAKYNRANKKGEDLRVYVMRDDNEKNYDIESYSVELLESQGVTSTKVQIGISPRYKMDFAKLLYMPFVETGDACMLIFRTLKLLFTDATVNIDDLSGPIGIFSIIKTSVSQGLLSVLNWTAIISVNVGFMNLLPLPALDGGRLAFMAYEGITRKKPNPKVENIIHTIGFVLLMVLFVFVAFNDVIRAFFR